MKNHFSENFIRQIKEQEICTKDMAEDLNIAYQTLNNWKHGKSKPTLDGLIIIADYLDLTIDELVK